jgi:pyridoxal phosphate enzyme (YggS family)
MISDNLREIRERISRRCRSAGRSPEEVTLVAVSKTFSSDKIREALAAGVQDIGENYVQELVEKRKLLPDESVRWHFVGHLQRNKVKQIISWIHLVHALDDRELAVEIDRRAARAERTVNVLIEVNTTGEGSKFGLEPERTAEFVRSLDGLEHITVAGLMTIGPFLPDPEESRPMFRQLRLLKEEIAARRQANVAMHHLSMGMTGDFEVAIDEGATLVRIGSAIFGSRRRPA